jgi:hypothetical protein
VIARLGGKDQQRVRKDDADADEDAQSVKIGASSPRLDVGLLNQVAGSFRC